MAPSAFAIVQQYSQQRGQSQRILLSERHYVMLSREGQGRVYVRDGQLWYEEGVPVPAQVAAGWQDLVDAIAPSMQELVGLRTPTGTPNLPVAHVQWIYGPEESDALYVHHGAYFTEAGVSVHPGDLPSWAREAIAGLSPRERKRAGLLMLTAEAELGDGAAEVVAEEELSVPRRVEAEALVKCRVCKDMVARAEYIQHTASHMQREAT